jgi:hypothetical protein
VRLDLGSQPVDQDPVDLEDQQVELEVGLLEDRVEKVEELESI